MNKYKENTLRRASIYLEKYKDDKSIYYDELKKSYKEYKNLDLKDKVTNDLYLNHLNELCDFIKSKKHANKIMFMLVSFSIFIIILCCFTTYKYYELSNSLASNVLFKNTRVSLSVNYSNTENFDANTLSNDSSYKDLEPLTLSLYAHNKSDKKELFHYDVYLIEQNENVPEENILSKDAFLYNVTTKNKESGIKSLKYSTLNKNRLLIYSGEMFTNEEEELNIRMWIDSQTELDYINKKYKFKLFVEGYLV